jgi:hypothetical protein
VKNKEEKGMKERDIEGQRNKAEEAERTKKRARKSVRETRLR